MISRGVAAFGIALAALAALACAPDTAPTPNVVLLSLDTTRRDHLPFYGYPRDTAPRMAELAARGVVFEDAVAVHTNTAPAHASMLTGLYPMQHGIERNGQRLRDDATTLAEILADRGYATAAFISGWTLTRHTGLDRGFAVYDQRLHEERRRNAERTLEAALPWLDVRAERGGPFFLFIHLCDPHWAYDPPEPIARRFLPDGASVFTTAPEARPPGPPADFGLSDAQVAEIVARYDGEIAYADQQLGRLVARLDAHGLAEHTVVVVTSDHGETLHERDWVFDHGARVFDEQVRVPLVIRLPGERPAGARVRATVSQVDLLPTLLDLLEIPVAPEVVGRSLVSLLAAESSIDRERPTFAHARPEATRVPEVAGSFATSGLVSMVRVPGAKLIEYPIEGGWARQLFDLENDPGETRNVAADRPALVAFLHEKLEAFRNSTGAARTEPAPLAPEVEDALRDLGYVR
jgi:arylsulfatase A-like enzyme